MRSALLARSIGRADIGNAVSSRCSRPDQPKTGMAVWDTMKPAGALATPADLGQKAWTLLPGPTTASPATPS